jgi:hypothetical protein
MLNYLRSPLVGCAVLLEHGCEKTHNDYMRLEMARMGMRPEDFGFASVQLDGMREIRRRFIFEIL